MLIPAALVTICSKRASALCSAELAKFRGFCFGSAKRPKRQLQCRFYANHQHSTSSRPIARQRLFSEQTVIHTHTHTHTHISHARQHEIVARFGNLRALYNLQKTALFCNASISLSRSRSSLKRHKDQRCGAAVRRSSKRAHPGARCAARRMRSSGGDVLLRLRGNHNCMVAYARTRARARADVYAK